MITLHTFGTGMKLPSPSPFVMKAEMLLKMSGQPYRSVVADLSKSPKGKIPFITDGEKIIGDSTFIRFHLEHTYGVDFDKDLNSEQKGIAWAAEKLCEDNLYFAIVNEWWTIDDNFKRGPAMFFQSTPALIRPFITTIVRKKIQKTLHAQGFGHHTHAEIVEIFNRGMDAVSAILGSKKYMMGDKISAVDAIAFGTVASSLTPVYEDGPLYAATKKHNNLIEYRNRMMGEYFPEFA